jgi:hypothetical protein
VASIVFERQPRQSTPVELEIISKEEAEVRLRQQQELEKAFWADSWQRRKETTNASRKIKNLSEEEKEKARACERKKKAAQREKKKLEAIKTSLSAKMATKPCVEPCFGLRPRGQGSSH